MRVFTVLGPSQSGKTTLVEALGSLEGRPRRLALNGDTAVTRFDFMGDAWAALDIPGGLDSLAAARPALLASDAAVLCVPADAESAVLAAPYMRLLEEAGLPTYIFINKMDSATDRVADIVAALQPYAAHGIVLRQIPVREGGQVIGAVDLISERTWQYREGERSQLVELPEQIREREKEARTELLEHLADFDDHLLEELIEDQTPMTEEIYEVATRVLQHHDLIPALLGAASHGNGVLRLMKSLRHEAPQVDALRGRLGEDVIAVGALADNVKHLGKTILVRALGPGVAQGAELAGESVGALVDVDQKTPLSELAPGAVGLAAKSDHLALTQPLYGKVGPVAAPDWAAPPRGNYRMRVSPVHEKDETRLSSALARLQEIDPGLTVEQDEASGQAILATQGPQHLRRITEKLAEVFGIEVETQAIPPALCETIRRPVEKHYRHRKQTGGAGQFADVVIDVRPLGRGEGFVFTEEVKGGAVPRNYIPAVEAGARDALASGPNGNPVVDIAVNLKDGKHHAVDSSDFAFRTAGRMAVKEALEEAGTQVLQPISMVVIDVPSVYSGGLVPLISGLKGQVLGFEANPDAPGWDEFRTLLPKSAEPELFNALASATRGTASFRSELDHYEEMHDAPRRAAS